MSCPLKWPVSQLNTLYLRSFLASVTAVGGHRGSLLCCWCTDTGMWPRERIYLDIFQCKISFHLGKTCAPFCPGDYILQIKSQTCLCQISATGPEVCKGQVPCDTLPIFSCCPTRCIFFSLAVIFIIYLPLPYWELLAMGVCCLSARCHPDGDQFIPVQEFQAIPWKCRGSTAQAPLVRTKAMWYERRVKSLCTSALLALVVHAQQAAKQKLLHLEKSKGENRTSPWGSRRFFCAGHLCITFLPLLSNCIFLSSRSAVPFQDFFKGP